MRLRTAFLNLPETARETVTTMPELKNLDKPLCRAWPEAIVFSTSRRGLSKRYERIESSAEKFVLHVSRHEVGDKEGSAWSPFDFRDDIRETANCIGADVFVLDLDNGTPLDEIETALRDAGLAAVVVSSHSHGSTRTKFSTRELDKWRVANPDADDEDFLRTRAKGYHRSVWRRSTIARDDDGEPLADGEGRITVEHAPCAKFRLVVPLAAAFLVSDYRTQGEAARAWKGAGHALADELRITPDANAFDLARLFFDPRHPAGVAPVVRFVSGEPFDAERTLARARGAGRGSGRGDGKARPGARQARESRSAVKVFGGNIKVLRSALMAIKNDERFAERHGCEGWLKILGAVSYETDHLEEGHDLAHEWSATFTGNDYSEAATDAAWDSVRDNHPNAATGATLRKFALRDGWRPPEGFVWGDGWTESQIVFEDEREIRDIVDSMNAEFAVIKNKGSVRILHECKDESGVDAFDLMKQEDFRLLTKGRGVVKAVTASGKPAKGVPIADHWLGSPQRREYAGLVFRPGEEPRQGDGSNRPKFLNLWTRWGVEPNSRGSCRMFKDHLLDNVCSGDKGLFNWLLDWMAHIFQRPREKPGVAVVLLGKKGAGKSIVGETLGMLVGRSHYFVASHHDQLLGKHNAALAKALLIQAEEAFFVHDPKTRGLLKDFITRRTRTVEPKFVDAYLVEACDRLIMTSNEEAVVPADRGERRFTVFNVDGARARDTAYFGALVGELENGGYERLLYELQRRDLHDFDCRTAYETEALAEQKLLGLDKTAQWALDELTSGELWEDSRGEPCFRVSKRIVRNRYLDFVRDMRVGHPMGEARLGEWLVSNLGFKPKRLRSGGELEQCYIIPALWDARERFIARFELPTTIFDEADREGPQKHGDVFRVKAGVQGGERSP